MLSDIGKILLQFYLEARDDETVNPYPQEIREKAEQAIEAYIAERETKARIDEWKWIKEFMVDGRTVHPMAPSHDNYILKVDTVSERLSELKSNERAS